MKSWILGAVAPAAIFAACSNQVSITAEATGGNSSGTGGSPSGGKLVTADTDPAQYQSISVELLSSQPMVQGPFFVTDVFVDNSVTLYTVMGSDCSAAPTKILQAPNGVSQFHGMRMPILAGQGLCHMQTGGGTLTVLGFKPY